MHKIATAYFDKMTYMFELTMKKQYDIVEITQVLSPQPRTVRLSYTMSTGSLEDKSSEYNKTRIAYYQNGSFEEEGSDSKLQTGINPNTAQKAYRLMTEEGYVVTDGNSGSYLRLTPALREKIDEELTRGLVEDFVARAKANRLSYKKVIALVSELWDDEA